MNLDELRVYARAFDQQRGHDFVPPDDVLDQVPQLYATEPTPTPDKIVRLHYFAASADWWLVEIDHTSTTIAFGYCCLGDPTMAEWGYVDLAELVTARPLMTLVETDVATNKRRTHTARLWVERDLYFDPRPFKELRP